MTLSEYLTRLRNDTDLTYQNISDMTGIHINTVQNIINGKTKTTTIDKAQKLVMALGGSLDVLQRLDYMDGDALVDEAKSVPTETKALADYTIGIEARMQYQSAILRERKINHTLTIALVCVSFLLLLLTVAVIALFVYDFTHPDRGWYQAFQRLTAHI